MKNLLAGLFAIILVGLTVQAQSNSYYGGETIENTEHGYSFTAPANWRAEKSQGNCAGVILTNPSETINIVVKPHHSNSLANFIKNESNLAGKGYQRVGEVRDLANEMKYIRVYKPMNGYNLLVDIIFIPFSNEGGVAVMNITSSESAAEEAMRNSINIINSLNYSTQTSDGQSSQDFSSPSARQNSGSSVLASKRLYAESGSSQVEIILCPSGTYTKNSNFFFSGGTSTDFENGTWGVQNGSLILNSSSGEQTVYQVSNQTGSSIALNGRQYSMQSYGCR